MITDFEYLPLFFIVRCSEEVAIGRFYRYLSMQEKLPVANSMHIQLVNMHKKLIKLVQQVEIGIHILTK